MSESFEDVVKYAKAVMADCDMPIVDRLNAAHDYEMLRLERSALRDVGQIRREEYHRGYQDGLHARDTATWQLDQERREVVRALKAVNFFLYYEKDNGMLAAIASCIDGMRRWNQENCEHLRDRLIHLLGGENELETDPISPKSVENQREAEKDGGEATQFTTTDTTKTSNLRLDKDLAICGIEPKAQISDEESGPDVPDSADMTNSTITDELRKFKGHINAGLAPEMVLALRAEVNGIADRIDAEFAKLAYERSHFEHERDYWHQEATDNMNRADDMEHELNNLTEALAELHANPLEDELVKVENERDELEKQVASLKRAAERDADHIESVTGALEDAERERDRIIKERDGLNAYANEQHEKLGDAELEIRKLEARCEMLKQSCDDALAERDQLATKAENQRKRLNQLEKIVNTWNYEDGTYWSPMAADKTVRKANEKAERLHVRNYQQSLQIAALSEECEMYREMLNDATAEYKSICGLCDTNCNAAIEAQATCWTLLNWRFALLELLKDAASEFKGLMEERKGSVDEQRQ